jgi:uncharacterized protein YukJ
MITTLAQFIQQCEVSSNDQIYEMFEFNCNDTVRTEVYFWADLESSEPFRSAMFNLGFTDY